MVYSCRFEMAGWCRDRPDFDQAAAVADVVEDPHGMLAFFLGLCAHEPGEALEAPFLEVCRHGKVLLGRGLLLVELGVQGGLDIRFQHVMIPRGDRKPSLYRAPSVARSS